MSIECYPTESITISVDNPGYGYVSVHVDHDERCTDHCWSELAGPKLGRALRELQQAIGGARESGRSYLSAAPFGRLSIEHAHKVLVSLTTAIVYAAAGSEFAERVLEPVEPGDSPRPPVCVRCGEGHVYASEVTASNTWCVEHGHAPYGAGDPSRGVTWQRGAGAHPAPNGG